MFFQPRNDSASGVDPDITVQDAYSQIPRISNATDIPANALKQLVDSKTDAISKIFGDPYVNVLDLNLALIQTYPTVYASFTRLLSSLHSGKARVHRRPSGEHPV